MRALSFGRSVARPALLAVSLSLAAARSARGADKVVISGESRTAVLARVLQPFEEVFAKSEPGPNHALRISARVELLTGLPAALVGSPVEIAVETPDKVRITGPIFGEMLTIGRHGQQLWLAPGSKAQAALAAAERAQILPPPDPKYRLEPLVAPLPEQQLAFLPALFEIRDLGPDSLDGATCRVMDLALVPLAAKSLKVENWTARIWVKDNNRLARLSVVKPGFQAAFRIEQYNFYPALPPATWQPPASGEGEILRLDPAQFQQIWRALIHHSPDRKSRSAEKPSASTPTLPAGARPETTLAH